MRYAHGVARITPRRTALVPRIVLAGGFTAAIPACIAVAMSACSDDDEAMKGKDVFTVDVSAHFADQFGFDTKPLDAGAEADADADAGEAAPDEDAGDAGDASDGD